jgi:hypothetical protein
MKEQANMITGELKSKIDRIWDSMWSGGISNPMSLVEQLAYLLFIKRQDEDHNGNSLFTCDAGQGESNIRSWVRQHQSLQYSPFHKL